MHPSASPTRPVDSHAAATAGVLATFATAVVAALVASFALPAPADAMTITMFGDDTRWTVGSGHPVSIERKVGTFSTLRMEGAVDVEAHPGTTNGVVVHADDNLVPLIETVIEGDALVIRPRKGASYRTSDRMFVEVTFTTLSQTRQNGSGDLHITALTAPRLEAAVAGSGNLTIDNAQVGSFALSIAGSGDARLVGKADDARFAIAGSGDVAARDFVARRVAVSISGSGDARVNATDTIEARVAGSGDVTYGGHPHDVSRRVTGSGSIDATH